jgi:hypothetical protein
MKLIMGNYFIFLKIAKENYLKLALIPTVPVKLLQNSWENNVYKTSVRTSNVGKSSFRMFLGHVVHIKY